MAKGKVTKWQPWQRPVSPGLPFRRSCYPHHRGAEYCCERLWTSGALFSLWHRDPASADRSGPPVSASSLLVPGTEAGASHMPGDSLLFKKLKTGAQTACWASIGVSGAKFRTGARERGAGEVLKPRV